jgi:indolepyruvate ferredoxin oxidoreductase
MSAEGVKRIAIVSEDPDRYAGDAGLPFATGVHHRDDLDAVQKQLARVGGVSVMIYDQTCAAEKRRRRKRGSYPDPDRRIVVNELVAIVPVETPFGRKRAIDQSVCNKDFSCVNGFCPSFVTVHGAVLKKGEPARWAGFHLPEPAQPRIVGDYAILITGVGGTGVVTIGALLAMAAHLEGKAAAVIDMAGLAQKGGPVTSHVRLAAAPSDIKTIRVAAAGADLVLACDIVVASSAWSLAAIDPGCTDVLVNTHETYPGSFTRNPDYTLPTRRMIQAITARAGVGRSRFIEATRIATALTGDSIATNVFMLGYALQAGAVPLSTSAIERAIELNGVDVAMNMAAFTWGRRAAVEQEVVTAIADRRSGRAPPEPDTLDELIVRRVRFLADYQSDAYGRDYADTVTAVREAEARATRGRTDLTEAVARNLFKNDGRQKRI